MALARSDRITGLDEAALHGAIGVALMAGVLAAGAGSGSPQVGLVGAGLVAAGSLVSWRIRDWGWRGWLLGSLLGLLAGAMFLLYVERESAWEGSSLYNAQAEVGLLLALYMAVIPIALSFVLIRYEIIAFSLVPTLSAFGLVGSQGRWTVVTVCFAVFLPAALVAMGHGMLLSGISSTRGRADSSWRLGPWRTRHWIALGSCIALVAVLAYALYFPVSLYASRYRWSLLARVVPRVHTGLRQMQQPMGGITTFPVGRGPSHLTDTPVLSIRGEPSPFWRGQAFDLYAGRAWLRSEESIPPEEIATIDRGVDLAAAFPAPPGAGSQTHVVRAETDLPDFVFFSPGQIQRLTPAGSSRPRRITRDSLRVDEYGCVERSEGFMRSGFAYEVVSVRLDTRPQKGQAGAQTLDQLSPNYFSVPFGSRRVADLARRIAGAQPTPERKLAALTNYLQRNCAYTLNAPMVPLGQDAVDYFLFRSRRGHCDLFASALALMARAVGIPTRVVSGYAYPSPGPGGPEGQVALSAGEQPASYIFRESDAHAWVEAYLPDWGWVTADATPTQGDPPMPLLRRSWLALRFFREDHPIVAAGLAAALVVTIALLAMRARGIGMEFLRDRLRPTDPRSSVVRTYAHLLRFLRRRGRRRRLAQTPLEFLSALASGGSGVGHALPAITSLTELFLAARYGPGPVSEDTAALAAEHLAEARQQLRRRVRHREAP